MHSSPAFLKFLRLAVSATVVGGAVLTAGPADAAAPRHSAAAQPQPCVVPGHGPGAVAAVTFGRTGGNIRPMQVAIYGDGTITYQGATPVSPTYTISPQAVLGLQRLAVAEGFWTMPPLIAAPGVLPDIATQFITIRQGCATTTKTVRSHGGQPEAFAELYATLTAAAAIPSAPSAPPPTPATGPQAITRANAGQTLQYDVGQSFLLNLGGGYNWTVTFSNPGVFAPKIGVMVIKGAQGIYVAKTAGQTTLTAIGDPPCRSAHPACGLPSLAFTVNLVVRPAQ